MTRKFTIALVGLLTVLLVACESSYTTFRQ